MVAQQSGKLADKSAKSKREATASATGYEIVSAAAADASNKRRRASGSTGILKFCSGGDAAPEMMLSMATADFFHSFGINEDAATSRQFGEIIRLSPLVNAATYTRPGRDLIGGSLLTSLSDNYDQHSLSQLEGYKEDYGLAGASDGATIHRTPLINFLAIVCSVVVLLEVVDCTGYMAEGGTKDGSFIAREMIRQCKKIGIKFFFLMIFDGASNMQSAGRLITTEFTWITPVWCALHLVHLIFGRIGKISEVARLLTEYKSIRNWVVSHHFQHDLYKKLVMEHNGGVYLTLPSASDTRMGGHFQCLWRILRVRRVLIEMVNNPEYISKKFGVADPMRDFVMDENNWHEIYSLLRAIWPLIKLLRLGDTNDATMGYQYMLTIQTETLIKKAISTDTTLFMVTVGPELLESFNKYKEHLLHDFAISAFLLSPLFVVEAKQALIKKPDLLQSLKIIARRVLSVDGDDDDKLDEDVCTVIESLEDFHGKKGSFSDPMKWKSQLVKKAPHSWHYSHSMDHPALRQVGMKVLSKPTGAGAPERNWADVKYLYNDLKATTSTERMERKLKVFTIARRDRILSGKSDDDFVGDSWKDTDEVFDGLGLEKWDYAEVSSLTAAVTSQRRKFKCWVESDEKEWIKKEARVNEASLLRKYKGIRFFDEEIGCCGTYYRIRSDSFKWHVIEEGKKKGVWAVSCDIMTTGCPSTDPDHDIEITADCEPEDYFINKELHDMIELTVQADGVELELYVAGGRASSGEEEDDEEGDGDESPMMRVD
jgi:hypothetical protein